MLERIIKFCLGQKGLILLIIAVLVAAGVYSVWRLPLDAFPDVSNNQVEVLAEAPGLAAYEIERFVTYPIEMALRGLPGVQQLRSVTKFGLSVVTVVFDDNVDVYFARQQVFERLSKVREDVPPGVSINLGPVATAMGEIYQYTLQAPKVIEPDSQRQQLTDLRTLQDWIISPLLKSIPGVSEVNSFGGYIKQYHIDLSPQKLQAYNLTVDQIFDALSRTSANVGGNIIERHDEQYIVRGIGLVTSIGDLSQTVLKAERGAPVVLSDVAEIKLAAAVRQGAAVMNGESETVGGIVMMLRGENPREVVHRIQTKVAEINSSQILPAEVRLRPFYQRSEIVEESVSTVSRALLEGAALVLIILYLFLRSIRGALVVLLALPLSLLLTFVVMRTFNLSANLMSLGGLAVSIGMIIDATIIQVENVQRHLSTTNNGDGKRETVLKSVLEVRRPSIFGELIIALTFLPILSLQGMEGKMFTPLAMTVAIALLASLMLSIFIIPVLCNLMLKSTNEKKSILLTWAERIYWPLHNWGFRNKIIAVTVPVLALIGTLALVPYLGSEFIPIMDEGAFDMDVQFLPGISLERAVATSLLVEKRLKQFPELETIVGRTGQTGIALEARGVDKTGYVGTLKPRSQWTSASTREELTEKMRNSLADIPGMVFGFSQPIQCRIDELVAGTRAQLIVKLFGDDLELLKSKADEIAKVLAAIPGAADLIVERVAGQPYLIIQADRDRIARHGLQVADVMSTVEIAVGGKMATQLYESNKSFDVVLRYAADQRASAETIGQIMVVTPAGYRVPLNELCEIKQIEGPVQISREDGQRRIGIEVNVTNRDIGSFVKEAHNRLDRHVDLPAGYYVVWGGQFENQQRAMARLMIIAPLTMAIMFMLLLFTFRSGRIAALVMLNLPFALIGGVLALFISGLYLSVPASIGFIVLFGVAVLNGVVLVSYIMQLYQNGMDLQTAIENGCRDRLRPVLMTAAISIFSLLPMLFASGPGSEIQRPLATVVVGGLFSSTFLTMLLLPMGIVWAMRRK